MKKIILSALLLAFGAAATAHAAITYPRTGVDFICDYTNYSGPAADGGLSWWERRSAVGSNPFYTYEHFLLADGVTWENYKATWAKPVPIDNYGKTQWEFTFLNGPQCKNTVVFPGGSVISFGNCTDGHTRFCYAIE